MSEELVHIYIIILYSVRKVKHHTKVMLHDQFLNSDVNFTKTQQRSQDDICPQRGGGGGVLLFGVSTITKICIQSFRKYLSSMAVNPVAVIRNNKGWLLQCGDDHPHTLFAVQKFIWWPDLPIIQG